LRNRLLALVVLGAIVLSLSATGIQPTTAQDNSEGVHVQVAMSAPESLDPVSLSRFAIHERDLVENLLVGLTRLNARSGQVEPFLAENWTVSADGLRWTFNLRNDVQWVEMQNGEATALRPVDAHDVVFTIQRACDPTRPSPTTSNLVAIVGCHDIANLQDTWTINQEFLDQYIGVRALDDFTVEIELLYPAAYFLTITTLPEFRPLPRERVVGNASFPALDSVVTSGAWVISEWNQTHMLLATNPHWELEKQGNVERIDIRFDVGADVLAQQILDETVDVARINASTADMVSLGNTEIVHSTEGKTLSLVGFSFEHPPLNNMMVRQALALAIDREGLAAQLSATGTIDYLPMARFTPRNVIASSTTRGATFDATVAQSLMASAGYPQCANFPSRITLAVEESPTSIAMAQYVVQQWNQNLGCGETFVVGTATRQALVDTAHQTIDASAESTVGRFQVWLITWTGDYPDANAWTSDALHCQFGALHPGRMCDSTDTLLDQAGISGDLNSRFTTYGQAENNLFGSNGSFPVLPLVITSEYWAQQTSINNIAMYGSFQFDRWQVSDQE
jgi:ABC-type oligopeptide transport system substrate-binding subunit